MQLYIPLWLYINPPLRVKQSPVVALYIPLWLYINLWTNSLFVLFSIFTFHSGYILIMRWRVIRIFADSFTFHSGYILIWHYFKLCQCVLLYIPLWLYINWSNPDKYVSAYTLYIPLWLYINPLSVIDHTTFLFFTFHSGYILIYFILYFKILFLYFTFHSGYILIDFNNAEWLSL